MLHSITTAADLLARLRTEEPSPALCDALADLLNTRTLDSVDGLVLTPPTRLESKDDLLAHALAALFNHHQVHCWEVEDMADNFEWEALYMAGASVLAERGVVRLPGGVNVSVEPILELEDLHTRHIAGEHLLVHVSTDASAITFAHSDSVYLPSELRDYPEVPDFMLPRDVFEAAESAFAAALAARGVMAGVLQFLRGVELSAQPLLALIQEADAEESAAL